MYQQKKHRWRHKVNRNIQAGWFDDTIKSNSYDGQVVLVLWTIRFLQSKRLLSHCSLVLFQLVWRFQKTWGSRRIMHDRFEEVCKASHHLQQCVCYRFDSRNETPDSGSSNEWILLVLNHHDLDVYLAIGRSHQINKHQRWQVSST